MYTLIEMSVSAICGIVLFAAACAMVGLGFAVIGMLALAALVAIGVAVLIAPFAARFHTGPDDTMDVET